MDIFFPYVAVPQVVVGSISQIYKDFTIKEQYIIPNLNGKVVARGRF